MAVLVEITLIELLLVAILFVLMDIAGYWTLLWAVISRISSALLGVISDGFPGAKFWIFLLVFSLALILIGELSTGGRV